MATANKFAKRTLPITDVKLVIMIDAEMDDMLEVLGRRLRLTKSSICRMAICRLNEDSLTKASLDEEYSRAHVLRRPAGTRAYPLRDDEATYTETEDGVPCEIGEGCYRGRSFEAATRRKDMQLLIRMAHRAIDAAKTPEEIEEFEQLFARISDRI